MAVKINVINTSKSDEKPTRPAFELNSSVRKASRELFPIPVGILWFSSPGDVKPLA